MRNINNMTDIMKRIYIRYFVAVIAIITVVLAIRSLVVTTHSIGDEAHMVATSFRFFLGDAPLVDDWSPEQLNGIVMLPIVAMFVTLKGTTEGLFIFMRFSCILAKFLILLYGYRKLKYEENAFEIFIALALWYVYMPFNFDNFTYQVVPVIALMYCLIVVRSETNGAVEWSIAGALYAISILSQPFWIMSYILIVGWIFVRYKDIDVKKIIGFHVGIVTVTMLFVILVFSRATFTQVIQNIPMIFAEPDHNVTSQGIGGLVLDNIIKVIWKYIWDNKVTSIINVIYISLLLVMKDKRERLKGGMFICLIIALIDILLNFSAYTMNWMYVAFAWMAIESLFYKNKRVYTYLLSLSVVFFVSIALGTNVSYFSSAHSMAMMAYVVLFYYDGNDNLELIEIINRVIPVCVVIYALFVRVFICYSDILSSEFYEYKIKVGPMDGLYTNQYNYERYMEIYNDISEMHLGKNDVLFVSSEKPLAYLIAQVEYGTMGTPFFYLDNDRLGLYYDTHPYKIPTKVY